MLDSAGLVGFHQVFIHPNPTSTENTYRFSLKMTPFMQVAFLESLESCDVTNFISFYRGMVVPWESVFWGLGGKKPKPWEFQLSLEQ